MPYGAHETMEMHECLVEKINCITHFNLYAKATNNPQLLDMIIRHQQEEVASYNEIIACTRGNSRFNPLPPNTTVQGVGNQQIQYGLRNPPQFAPQAEVSLGDQEIALAMLHWHKSGAKIGLNAALESADPNIRRLMLNCAATCTNQAYEVFLFLNQQGVYQIPTLKDQTQETFMQSYQPASGQLAAQYGMQSGMQSGGQIGMQTGNYGYGGTGMSATLPVGTPGSVLYGAGRNAYNQ